MEERLQQLRKEYERGLRQMAGLERRRLELQQTLLRIDGAIHVLQELLDVEHPSGDGAQSEIHPLGA